MDLYSRKIILWNILGKPAVNLIITAFKKAYTKRNAPLALMFHSDNDSQYTSISFRRLLDNCNVIESFSKKIYPYDNATAESFLKFLKHEDTPFPLWRNLKSIFLIILRVSTILMVLILPNNILSPNEKERLLYTNFFA